MRGEYGDFAGRFPNGRPYMEQTAREMQIYYAIQAAVKKDIQDKMKPDNGD